MKSVNHNKKNSNVLTIWTGILSCFLRSRGQWRNAGYGMGPCPPDLTRRTRALLALGTTSPWPTKTFMRPKTRKGRGIVNLHCNDHCKNLFKPLFDLFGTCLFPLSQYSYMACFRKYQVKPGTSMGHFKVYVQRRDTAIEKAFLIFLWNDMFTVACFVLQPFKPVFQSASLCLAYTLLVDLYPLYICRL